MKEMAEHHKSGSIPNFADLFNFCSLEHVVPLKEVIPHVRFKWHAQNVFLSVI